MNDTAIRFFGRTISSNAFDMKLGQAVCYVASVVLLFTSWWKLKATAWPGPEHDSFHAIRWRAPAVKKRVPIRDPLLSCNPPLHSLLSRNPPLRSGVLGAELCR